MLNLVKQLVEHLPFPAFVIDELGTIAFANAEAADLLPVLRTGLNAAAVIRDSRFHSALERLVHAQSGKMSLDVETPGQNGKTLRAHLAVLWHENQRWIVVILQDRSEREALARARLNFVASASHELRTPLAAIIGIVETLTESARNDPEAQKEFLRLLAAQARRMQRLVDDLLSLSRMEMQAHEQPRTIVNVEDILAQAIELMHSDAERAGVILDFAVSGDGPFRVRGEAGEIEQVVQNLLSNALTYGAEGGKVKVRLKRRRDEDGRIWIRFSVRDYGPGVSRKHLPHLTERFYRVDKLASRAKGGTGLGLAIVKHIVERHRGCLTLSSKPGKGLKAKVDLPACQ